MNISCEDLVKAIDGLQKGKPYTYINKSTDTVVAIENIECPHGPITIRRWNPAEGETQADGTRQTISKAMLFRVANALEDGVPLNIDGLLRASYNTRSALEALLCHTPEFYFCYPGRVENKNGVTRIRPGHKHIIWLPDEPHQNETLVQKELQHLEINEIPPKTVVYNALELPADERPANRAEAEEKHMRSLMQMAIYEIGIHLGFDTYIAKNDSGKRYKGKPLSEHPRIVCDLSSVPTVNPYDGAVNAGKFIDCIWLARRGIPAVIEIEHATNVKDSLSRMQGFMNVLPEYKTTRYIIVAPDERREKVTQEINKPQFAELQAKYMPYSAVADLLSLCQERKLRGINENFIDTFLEEVFVAEGQD